MQRLSCQRTIVLETLTAAHQPLLLQEAIEPIQATLLRLGIAPVYRQLKQSVKEGTLHVVRLLGKNARCAAARHAQYRHFQCTACQRVFDVQVCPGDLARLISKGFTINDHDLTLYGSWCDWRQQQAL
jgi:Fur family ferric uptake transcriptional regulator